MKISLIILIAAIFLSCNNSTRKAVDASAADKIAEEEILNFPKKDTIRNTDESKPEIPDWLLGINDVMNKGRGQYGAYEIHKYTELSDSLSISVFEYSDGVCLRHVLKTYLRQKEIANLELALDCDRDISIPEYEWKYYEFAAPELMKIKTYREYVDDSLLDVNGYLKAGYDIESEEKIDSTITIYKINASGKINKQI